MKKFLLVIASLPLFVFAQEQATLKNIAIKLDNNKFIALNLNESANLQPDFKSTIVLAEDSTLKKLLESGNMPKFNRLTKSSGSGWQPEKNSTDMQIRSMLNQITSNSNCKKSDITSLASEFNSDISLNAAEMSEQQLNNLAECLIK